MVMTRMTPPVLNARTAELFWAKVDKRGPDDCWDWTGCRTPPKGYGKICVRRDGKQHTYIAHRIAFYLTTGEWPPVVMHKVCDRPCCNNPRHLQAGTFLTNNHDMIAKGRHSHGDEHWTRKRAAGFDPRSLAQRIRAYLTEHPEARPRKPTTRKRD